MTIGVPAREEVSVLIPAAGMGERLGMGPKALLPLHGGRSSRDHGQGTQVGAEVLVACARG